MSNNSLLVAIDGIDRLGKSTLAKLLAEKLNKQLA